MLSKQFPIFRSILISAHPFLTSGNIFYLIDTNTQRMIPIYAVHLVGMTIAIVSFRKVQSGNHIFKLHIRRRALYQLNCRKLRKHFLVF